MYFDANCPLCKNVVQWLKKKDKNKLLVFKPLQLSPYKNLKSVVFIKNGALYTKSKAIHEIMKLLNTNKTLKFLLTIFPRWFTDKIYDLIAKYRKHFFATNQ